MKLKTSVAAMCAVGLVSVLPAAHADLFTFDSNGAAPGGVIAGAAVFDQAPGNDLAQGAGTTTGIIPVGTVIPNLYQANLNSVLGANSTPLYSNGSNGVFYTFVAGFSETVTGSAVVGPAVVNTFSINPGGFFKMCAQTAPGIDLAGTGFACAGNGILNATAIGGTATSTGFPATAVPLDQSPDGNQRAPTQTVTSNGSAALNLRITFADPAFFPDLTAGSLLTFSFVNSSEITPFNQINPSFCFSSNGVANCDVPDNIGLVNGSSGPNFQLQADANQSFIRAVPEPGTLLLLGLGGIAAGFSSRRRKTA